jgi:hypothetical protein
MTSGHGPSHCWPAGPAAAAAAAPPSEVRGRARTHTHTYTHTLMCVTHWCTQPQPLHSGLAQGCPHRGGGNPGLQARARAGDRAGRRRRPLACRWQPALHTALNPPTLTSCCSSWAPQPWSWGRMVEHTQQQRRGLRRDVAAAGDERRLLRTRTHTHTHTHSQCCTLQLRMHCQPTPGNDIRPWP